MNTRPPVMAMGQNRYSDIFDYCTALGFDADDADRIATDLPPLWDGMDPIQKTVAGFLRAECIGNTWRLTPRGRDRAKYLVDLRDAKDGLA